MERDIRWRQRLSNYKKALERLGEALSLLKNGSDSTLNDLAKEGVIQRFEFTHELAWKVMKDYLEFQGLNVMGSRDAIRQALKNNLIKDSDWMESIQSRNLTSHTYDEEVAEEVFVKIQDSYYPMMLEFLNTMIKIEGNYES